MREAWGRESTGKGSWEAITGLTAVFWPSIAGLKTTKNLKQWQYLLCLQIYSWGRIHRGQLRLLLSALEQFKHGGWTTRGGAVSLCGFYRWSLQCGGFRAVWLLTWQLRAPKGHIPRRSQADTELSLWLSFGSCIASLPLQTIQGQRT